MSIWQHTGKPPRTYLAGFVLLGVGLRLVCLLVVPTAPVSDFWTYLHAALELRSSHRYSVSMFPPGYPLAIAAIFELTDCEPVFAAKLLNLALSALGIVLAGVLARRTLGPRTALIAVSIISISPRGALMPCVLASENLFIPLLLGLLLLIDLRRDRLRGWGLAAAAGALCAALSLTRSIGYLLGLLWLAPLLVDRRSWKRLLVETGMLLALQHAIMLPWALHNRESAGKLVFVTSAGGIDFFIANNPKATGDWYSGWSADLQRISGRRLAELSEWDVDRLAASAAANWVAHHPFAFLHNYLKRLRQFFGSGTGIANWSALSEGAPPPNPPPPVLPNDHFLRQHASGLRWGVRGAWLALAVASLSGVMLWLVRGRRGGEWGGLVPAAVAIAYLALLTSLFHVNDRYRWPAEDLLALFAALAIERVRLLIVSEVGGARTT